MVILLLLLFLDPGTSFPGCETLSIIIIIIFPNRVGQLK